MISEEQIRRKLAAKLKAKLKLREGMGLFDTYDDPYKSQVELRLTHECQLLIEILEHSIDPNDFEYRDVKPEPIPSCVRDFSTERLG